MTKLDVLYIRLSKFRTVSNFAIASLIVAGPYLIKGQSTYFKFFDNGIGMIIMYIIHLFIILLIISRYFFIYRAFSKKPYVEFLRDKVIVRLRKEEIFNLKYYKSINATKIHKAILISDDANKPIFRIPAQFLKQKDIVIYIDKINRKYRCDN